MRPDRLPAFRLGVEYRELRPISEGKRIWRYVLQRGVRLPIRNLSGHIICYHDKAGKVWARHDQYGLYIEEGYAWNGCSPKYFLNVIGWVGTPDFVCTRLASLCHDVHYQFAMTDHFPLHKSDVDSLFYSMIAMTGEEELAGLYFTAVDKYGKWTGRKKDGAFSTLL